VFLASVKGVCANRSFGETLNRIKFGTSAQNILNTSPAMPDICEGIWRSSNVGMWHTNGMRLHGRQISGVVKFTVHFPRAPGVCQPAVPLAWQNSEFKLNLWNRPPDLWFLLGHVTIIQTHFSQLWCNV